jgi:hypothetical protein
MTKFADLVRNPLISILIVGIEMIVLSVAIKIYRGKIMGVVERSVAKEDQQRPGTFSYSEAPVLEII